MVPWTTPVARSHPRTVKHRYLPYLWYYETPKLMVMEYGGGVGEDMDGDRRRSGGRQEGRVQQDEVAQSDHKNTLPLGGRVVGHRWLYGERGRGGADRFTGTTISDKGPRASAKGNLRLATPVGASRKSRPLRGAPSPTPLHPHPFPVQPYVSQYPPS